MQTKRRVNVNQRLRYPIDIQTFADIRMGNYVYVDKTPFLYNLRHGSGETYFLSRPRRFGKSLLLSSRRHTGRGNASSSRTLPSTALKTTGAPRPVIRLDLSTVKPKR